MKFTSIAEAQVASGIYLQGLTVVYWNAYGECNNIN